MGKSVVDEGILRFEPQKDVEDAQEKKDLRRGFEKYSMRAGRCCFVWACLLAAVGTARGEQTATVEVDAVCS